MIVLKNYLILSNDFVDITENIKKILKDINFSYSDIIKFDMEETYLEDVMEELNTYSLFSTNKVVVLYSCEFLNSEKKKGALIQNEKLLEDYINNPNTLNSLIICTSKLDERKKVNKLLREKCIVIDSNISIEDKIKNNLEDYKMDTKTINYLISYLKNDNERIINEFNKLKLYKLNEKEITIDDINEICIKDFDDNVFTLSNLILKHDIKKAFEVYSSLISSGEDITKIVAVLADQFRLIYKVKVLINDGKNKDTIISMVKEHPYRVKLAMDASYSFTYKELERYLLELGNIDIKIKTGVSANNFGFDIFLLDLL